MSIVVSPGVYSREIDFSLYAPQLATSVFGVVGTASKGPVNEVTLITDEATMIATFGDPSATHLGIHAALRYLRWGKQLKFVRVANYDASATGAIRDGADSADAVAVTAASTGSWFNGVSVLVSAGTDAGTYNLQVLYGGRVIEAFAALKVGAANVASSNYIETRINGVSSYISVVADTSFSTLKVGTYTMSGGDDGTPVDSGDYIGAVNAPPAIPTTGLMLFANPETIDVNIVAVPGVSDKEVVSALITLAETRGDCVAVIDPPQGLSVQQAVAWHNGLGTGDSDPDAALNSSYGCAYYSWLQVYDGYNDTNIYIPPSGHAAGVMAYTDFIADPWFAPAGLTRGRLADVLQVEHSPSQGERDYMYSNGNALNPIVNFPLDGVVIWGQRTLQRTPTALDRINVRRLLNALKKQISTAVRVLVFEPNDELTWDRFVNLVEPVLRDTASRRGIYDFRVVCDDTTNTPLTIDRNELHGKLFIKPTKAAEMIIVDFVVLNNEAQFEEFIG